MTFEYEKLLLLKSPQNKEASNIVVIKKNQKKTSQTYISGAFQDKFTDFTDEPVVKCNVLSGECFIRSC